MEESDNMLITTLRDYLTIPEHIQTLKDIKAQEIFLISLKMLQYLKVDINEVKSLSGKAQRFRSMAKLNQNLFQELQTQFQLNELMNPSIPFLRKFLLIIINKLGSSDPNEKIKDSSKNEGYRKQRQSKKELKNWINQQWIHPSLASRNHKYKGYILPVTINKNLLKNNINLTSELNNSLLHNNAQAILSSTLSKHNQRVKQFEANQGLSRKQNQEAAIRLNNIIKTNKDDWNLGNNKLQKLKKKMNDDPNQSSNISPPMVSVYIQQLQKIEVEAEKKKQIEQTKPIQEKKQNISEEDMLSLNPLQILRRQAENKRIKYQEQIREILSDLNERKQGLQRWQKQKQSMEQKMAADEQKTIKIKQQTAQLKKKVEKRQAILSTLQGEQNVEQEVKKIQNQINIIQNQVKNQVKQIQTDIKNLTIQGKQKMDALNELKAKLNRIQKDYERICEEITQKQQLKGNVKIMKSGISRLYYHKKISEMESRWKDAQRQTKKLRVNLKQLRQKTRVAATLNLRVQTQIENVLNSDKGKTEQQTKALKQLMLKCKQTFQKTLSTLEEVNEVKLQTQDYQMKVHGLSGKNYKQNIEKIGIAMEDLKKEIAQLSKSKSR